MSGTTWVKVCGLSTPETVDAAVDAGADAVGFVFAPGSPRTVEPSIVRRLIARVPAGVETVGVFRGQGADHVVAVAREAEVATVQLHGREDPSVFASVRAAGFGLIRALSASDYLSESKDARGRFGEVRHLLDAPDPGLGVMFESSGLLASPPARGWVLAGGLTPTNVALLLETLAPSGVDVSSGVERSRGVKDSGLIRDFVAAARAAG
ncbi:MAG: phosphoribosylanthranilate isomerase [Frondihabitans sp.]|nr:phosphoribosylanthranilate isomerase [Frondihabitans sp.]